VDRIQERGRQIIKSLLQAVKSFECANLRRPSAAAPLAVTPQRTAVNS